MVMQSTIPYGQSPLQSKNSHDSSLEAPCQASIFSMRIGINLREADGTASTSLECLAFGPFPLYGVASLSLQAKKSCYQYLASARAQQDFDTHAVSQGKCAITGPEKNEFTPRSRHMINNRVLKGLVRVLNRDVLPQSNLHY